MGLIPSWAPSFCHGGSAKLNGLCGDFVYWWAFGSDGNTRCFKTHQGGANAFYSSGERWEKTRLWSSSDGSCCLSFLISREGINCFLLHVPFASPPSQPAICEGRVSSWEKWEAENPQALSFAVPMLVCRTTLLPLLLVPDGEAVEGGTGPTARLDTLEM